MSGTIKNFGGSESDLKRKLVNRRSCVSSFAPEEAESIPAYPNSDSITSFWEGRDGGVWGGGYQLKHAKSVSLKYISLIIPRADQLEMESLT